MAIDSANNIYVADTGNDRIRRITPGGLITNVVTGLNQPQGVAFKGTILYIADTGRYFLKGL